MAQDSNSPESITRLTTNSNESTSSNRSVHFTPPAAHPISSHFLSPAPYDTFLRTKLQPAQPPDHHPLPERPKSPYKSPRAPEIPKSSHPTSLPSSSSNSTLNDAWNCISLLYLNPVDRKERERACEGLRNCPLEFSEFYLPQLCFLLVYQHQHSDMLENFILDQCVKSLHFSIKTSFIVGAVMHENAPPVVVDRIENFRYACQLAFINGIRPELEDNANPIDYITDFESQAAGLSSPTKSSSSSTPSISNHKSVTESGENSQVVDKSAITMEKLASATEKEALTTEKMAAMVEKEALTAKSRDLRFKYLWSIKRFMRELAGMGSTLMTTAELDRPAVLRSWLKELNIQIRQSGEFPAASRYIAGLYMPLSNCNEDHYAIVRIPEHEAATLKSRDRVPFMIVFETVSLPHPFVNDENNNNKMLNIGNNMASSSSIPTHHLTSSPDTSSTPPSIQYWKCGDQHIESLVSEFEGIVVNTSPKSTNPIASSHTPLPLPSLHEPQRTTSHPTGSTNPMSVLASPLDLLSLDSRNAGTLLLNATSLGGPPALGSELTQLHQILSVPQNTHTITRKELWKAREARIRLHSPFGKYPGWCLRSVIVKYGADCLQEQLALQLIKQFARFFEEAQLDLVLVPYEALVMDSEACLIEPLVDAVSIHQLKRNNKNISLRDFYLKKWNGPESPEFKQAQMNFVRSLAGYSLICYILQLKDRHNGNIMIDDEGYFIHIDWGFLLWNTPGSIGFETAPFKLTSEYIDLLGGVTSSAYTYFKELFLQGYMELRKHMDQTVQLIKIMFMCSSPTKVPCSAGSDAAIQALESRFNKAFSEAECTTFIENLISQAYNNWRTTNYDYYQYYSNGILS